MNLYIENHHAEDLLHHARALRKEARKLSRERASRRHELDLVDAISRMDGAALNIEWIVGLAKERRAQESRNAS